MKFRHLIATASCAALLGLASGMAAADTAMYKVVDDERIPESLTGKPGDAANGRAVAVDRRKGNCLACHIISEIKDQQFHGEVGPPLDDVGSRLSAGEVRLRVVDPKVVNPDTIMPSFHKVDGLHRVAKKWQGKTIISAQEVEDVVAYVMTLKGSYSQ